MSQEIHLFKLTGRVQHYQWGGSEYIPQLLGIKNTGNKPFAEYWLGAHVNAPALLEDGTPLDRFLAGKPASLGSRVQRDFGRLPYLLKVLDVKEMLSIQVHPVKEAAVIEFDRENKAGISLSAPNRNYKDDNHKPELMVALGEFWLLHGFRPEASLLKILAGVPEFDFMVKQWSSLGYEGLYRLLMDMEQEKVNAILEPLLRRIIPAYQAGQLTKDDPAFWAARGALTYNQPGRIDRGLFSIYLLNLVHLQRGEAVFQDAGILHAYLEGQNIEIMANSDNVLRGGLTPKHIDVHELMKHVRFIEVEPAILPGELTGQGERVYRTPAPDFELSSIDLDGGNWHQELGTAEIFLLLGGDAAASDNEKNISIHQGEALIGINGCQLTLKSAGKALLYRASVPFH